MAQQIQTKLFSLDLIEAIPLNKLNQSEKNCLQRCIRYYAKPEGAFQTIIFVFYHALEKIKSIFGRSDWQLGMRSINHLNTFNFSEKTVRQFISDSTLKALVELHDQRVVLPFDLSPTQIKGIYNKNPQDIQEFTLNILTALHWHLDRGNARNFVKTYVPQLIQQHSGEGNLTVAQIKIGVLNRLQLINNFVRDFPDEQLQNILDGNIAYLQEALPILLQGLTGDIPPAWIRGLLRQTLQRLSEYITQMTPQDIQMLLVQQPNLAVIFQTYFPGQPMDQIQGIVVAGINLAANFLQGIPDAAWQALLREGNAELLMNHLAEAPQQAQQFAKNHGVDLNQVPPAG